MLIKMTKIANPLGEMAMMRQRLEDIVTLQITGARQQITIELWGNQQTVDWQMNFLQQCEIHIVKTFLVHSPRWEISFVEIC